MTEILDAWKKIFKDRPMEQAFELGFKAGQESMIEIAQHHELNASEEAKRARKAEVSIEKARQDFAEEVEIFIRREFVMSQDNWKHWETFKAKKAGWIDLKIKLL